MAYTINYESAMTGSCYVTTEGEADKWTVSYHYDGSEEGETDLETESEADAREYFKNASKSTPSWSDAADRIYDGKTQLTYSSTEWSLAKYDAASDDYDTIYMAVTLRIYDTIDDYLANVCEEDVEEFTKNYYDGVEYLKRITNADNVVFGRS